MCKRLFGVAALAGLSALLMPSPPAAAQDNVLANPGFEEPDASGGDVPNAAVGWAPFGDPYTRWVTRQAPAQGGLQCLKLFGPWNQWGGTGMTQTFPAAPGQTWVAEIWSLNLSSDPMQPGNFCVMKILFLDSGGVDPPGGVWLAGVNVFEQRVADSTNTADLWQLFGVGSAPAPDGTAFAQFLIVEVQGNNPPLGGSVFLDDAVFRMRAATPCDFHNPVFDVNDDGKIDTQDTETFEACATGPGIPLAADASLACKCMDRDGDNDIDQVEFAAFQRCYTGPSDTVDPDCDNNP
jgi:hypothetical protein